MALQIAIELPSGITANYWKIIEVNMIFNYANGNKSQVILAGFASQDTRQNGKTEITTKMIDITGNDFTNTFASFSQDPRTNIYNFLKSTSEFSNASDI